MQGPPGAGKSDTIWHLNMRLDDEWVNPYKGQQVLVCATSNNATDEVMEKTVEVFRQYGRPTHFRLVRFYTE